VPLTSFSGISVAAGNEWTGSSQYNYAAKHNPQVFFTDSNGGNDATPANALSSNYAPLQQLFADLETTPWRTTTGSLRTSSTTCTRPERRLQRADRRSGKDLQGDDFLRQVVR